MHPLLELALGHLAVRDEEPELRAQLSELLGRLVDRLDAVVEVEGLPFPCVLPLEREPHELVVVLARRSSGSDAAPRAGSR